MRQERRGGRGREWEERGEEGMGGTPGQEGGGGRVSKSEQTLK